MLQHPLPVKHVVPGIVHVNFRHPYGSRSVWRWKHAHPCLQVKHDYLCLQVKHSRAYPCLQVKHVHPQYQRSLCSFKLMLRLESETCTSLLTRNTRWASAHPRLHVIHPHEFVALKRGRGSNYIKNKLNIYDFAIMYFRNSQSMFNFALFHCDILRYPTKT